MVYLDNAATSFPKPQETLRQLMHFVADVGGNPGRSGHPLSIDAARIIFEAREKLAELINVPVSERLVFTSNGTESLNLAILGLVQPGDHVVTTSLEHNSVMRPLDHLQKTQGVEVTVVPCSPRGELDPDDLQRAVRRTTRAVVINHGSNVIGTVQPLQPIRHAIGEIPLILDACQTIGNVPIDVQSDTVDVICFSCHKSLFGIQGLGAAYFRRNLDPRPLKFGGTGSKSESTEQPGVLPDKYESGTPNTPAIAALLGGLTFIETTGLAEIVRKKHANRDYLIKRLTEFDGATIHGRPAVGDPLAIVAMNLRGRTPSEVGYACNQAGVCVRVGLHCSPMAHRTIGTFPQGTVRVSPGYFTTDEDIEHFMEVLRGLVQR